MNITQAHTYVSLYVRNKICIGNGTKYGEGGDIAKSYEFSWQVNKGLLKAFTSKQLICVSKISIC